MNQHDRDNLNFLLGASEEVLRDWFDHVDDDDIDYARELLEMYKLELIDQAVEISDMSDADKYLSQLMKK